jgi:branched-chain amino acid transport system permease protein
MDLHVNFLIVGLGAGAVYASLALGLVVVFKGTGIINVAQGAIAMWGAFVFDEVRKTGDLVLPVGRVQVGQGTTMALAAAAASLAGLGLIAHALFRRLRTAPPLANVVASVGLMITIQAVVVLRFSSQARAVEPILPNEVVQVGSVSFTRDRLYLAGIAIVLAALLWAYFRFTRIGLATRACSENETAASLTGLSPHVLAAVTWLLSAVVTGGMVILASPSTGLNATNYALLVVPALAVALVGRLESLAVVCAAGLALGSFQSEITFLSSRPGWPRWAAVGLSDAVPLIVIVISLALVGRNLPARGAALADSLPSVIRWRNRPLPVAALAVGGALALALTSGSYRFAVVTSMSVAVIALSLVVLTGFLGQISLAQTAFAGVGGFTLSKLTSNVGIPFPISVVLAGLVAAAFGTLVGVPALRIRGAQLAVVTLAAAVAIEQFIFRNPFFSPPSGNPIRDASLLGLDLAVRNDTDTVRIPFGLMVLGILVLLALAVGNLGRSDAGRAFLAVRTNERAAAAAGVNVVAVKLAGFAIASFLAGVGGCLIGYSRGQLSAGSFTAFAGLSLLAFAYVGGITSVPGALIAGLLAPLGVMYVVLDRTVDLGRYYLLFSGLSLLVQTLVNPSGIAGSVRDRLRARKPAPTRAATTKEAAAVGS